MLEHSSKPQRRKRARALRVKAKETRKPQLVFGTVQEPLGGLGTRHARSHLTCLFAGPLLLKARLAYAKVYPVNPFVRYDLDAQMSPRELTESLRARIEDAATEEERSELRAAWDLLTKKTTVRVFLALEAGPDARPAVATTAHPRSRRTASTPLDVPPNTLLTPLERPASMLAKALSDPALFPNNEIKP